MEARRQLLCKGYLRKSPPEQKLEKNYKWRKRFFKLWSDKTLEYYKTDEDTRPLKEPLNLGSCAAVLPCDGKYRKHLKKDYPWLFSLPMPGRCYHFAARTEGEMIVWKREIGKICNFLDESDNDDDGDDDAIGDEADGVTPVDHSRTTSVSSQSHQSTSSTSSKSSPSQWRVHNVSIDEATAQLTTNYRTSSVSSTTGGAERFGYRSPETKSRMSSSPPMTSPRTPRSPSSTRPLYTSNSSFTTSIDGDHNYDILRTPARGALEETPEAHYDVPPSTGHLSHLSYQGRSVSLKQPSTCAKGETGYVDMKPKEDDYLEYENDNENKKVEKEFVSLPWMNQSKSKSLKERQNVGKNPPLRRTNTIALDQPVTPNETIHDEIPDMKDKKNKEVVSKEDPPKVERDKKPPPRVDRRKKPSKQEFLPRQQSITDYKEDVARNGTSAILNQALNSMHLNHHHTSHDTYLNHCTMQSTATHYNRHALRHCSDNNNDANNYDNLPSSPIRCDANGDKLTVGTPAHINLTLYNHYKLEPLPPNPSPDSEDEALSSPSSPYENSNEVFVNSFHLGDVSGNYENVETIAKDENSLTYSEVNAAMWMQRSPQAIESPTTSTDSATWIGDQVGSTGTHYVFVDIPKSTGLQLSKRSMEMGLAGETY